MTKVISVSGLLLAAWAKMPDEEGDKQSLPEAVSAESLLPPSREHYCFNGSLTTPPALKASGGS